MNTFLDTRLQQTRTFLVYGNLKDRIWPGDLIPRDLEHYLVQLLRSRGFRRVIFFGDAGNKGAYTLDRESARFFFSVNQGIPLPDLPDGSEEESAAPAAEETPATGTTVNPAPQAGAPQAGAPQTGSSVHDMLDDLEDPYADDDDDDAYRPGGLFAPDDEEEPDTPQAEADPPAEEQPAAAAPAEAPAPRPAPPRRVKYAFRNMEYSEFLQLIHDVMLDPKSHMAVVFYNLLSSSVANTLKDSILDSWERSGAGNLCLLLNPETSANDASMLQAVQRAGLESKFLLRTEQGLAPNPECCIRVGPPGSDEIRNLLRYLSIIGTDKGNRLRFPYRSLDALADRILYAIAERASRRDPAGPYMNGIEGTLRAWLDADGAIRKVKDLTVETIDRIWSLPAPEEAALERLRRPGWEKVETKVREALEIAKKQEESLPAHLRAAADWAVERVSLPLPDPARPSVPNFVLVGPPGTGKTTIARILGDVLREAGLLRRGTLVETNREGLTSSYVAGVPKATMAKVEEAEEGVLFIDEAHALGRKDGGANHEGTGAEVVSTLNAAMTDPSRHFSVVLAGYPGKMDAVFDLDPGFRRRFGDNIIVIDDYKPDLLYAILLQKLRENHVPVSPDLTEPVRDGENEYIPLRCMVEEIYEERDRENFGNAGVMEDLASRAAAHLTDGLVTRESFCGGLDGQIRMDWFEPRNLGATTDALLKEMDERFVGMESAKKEIRNLGLQMQECQERGLPLEGKLLRPLILVGNPGTGKTELARLLPRLYCRYGALGTSKPIMMSASSLASSFAGGTQEKIQEYIRKAQQRKAFLFVDEAHELCNESFDGRGAFKAFMAPTTDKEHPFLACFAVYESHLEKFLALDPGAESRFQIIHLDDYTGPQLLEIFQKMAAAEGLEISPETRDLLAQHFDRVYATRNEKTGNGRYVERLMERMNVCRRERCQASGIPFSDGRSLRFLPEDIPEELRRTLSPKDSGSDVERLLDIRARIQEERVGNEALKSILTARCNSLLHQKRFPGKALIVEPGHFFFKGRPGTGKTTGTEYFARFLHELGLVTSPEPISISATDLVGQYLGETGVKTRERLEQAVGRVLLIDEAYALTDANEHAMSFKRDAINEIVRFLDNETFRRTTCVIFAGYEHDMDGLYRENSGLKSRIQEVFFPDFTLEQCQAVLESILASYHLTLLPEAAALCREQLERMQVSREFSNGRTVRRYAGLLAGQVERRCTDNLETYVEDDPRAYQVMPEDVPPLPAVFHALNLN